MPPLSHRAIYGIYKDCLEELSKSRTIQRSRFDVIPAHPEDPETALLYVEEPANDLMLPTYDDMLLNYHTFPDSTPKQLADAASASIVSLQGPMAHLPVLTTGGVLPQPRDSVVARFDACQSSPWSSIAITPKTSISNKPWLPCTSPSRPKSSRRRKAGNRRVDHTTPPQTPPQTSRESRITQPAIAEFEKQQSIPPQSPFLPSTNSLPIHTRISQISRMLKIPKRRGFHRRPPPANQREGLANPTRQRKSFLSSTSPPKLFFSCAPNLKSTTTPPSPSSTLSLLVFFGPRPCCPLLTCPLSGRGFLVFFRCRVVEKSACWAVLSCAEYPLGVSPVST